MNQSINIRLFDGVISQLTQTQLRFCIAGLECAMAKYPECPAAYDLSIELNFIKIKIKSKTLARNSYKQSLDAKDNGAVTRAAEINN